MAREEKLKKKKKDLAQMIDVMIIEGQLMP